MDSAEGVALALDLLDFFHRSTVGDPHFARPERRVLELVSDALI